MVTSLHSKNLIKPFLFKLQPLIYCNLNLIFELSRFLIFSPILPLKSLPQFNGKNQIFFLTYIASSDFVECYVNNSQTDDHFFHKQINYYVHSETSNQNEKFKIFNSRSTNKLTKMERKNLYHSSNFSRSFKQFHTLFIPESNPKILITTKSVENL